MTPLDMQAWSANAARRRGNNRAHELQRSGEALRLYQEVPGFLLAAFKGQKLSLRDWNLQLRQPILLFDGRNTVSVSPQEGFLHPTSELDTLGRGSAGDQMQARIVAPLPLGGRGLG